jgi:hypothetical protein
MDISRRRKHCLDTHHSEVCVTSKQPRSISPPNFSPLPGAISAMADIAVIGFSFKLPQDVDDDSSFWETLQNRRNLMTEWPESRIIGASFEPNKKNKVCNLGPIEVSHIFKLTSIIAVLPGRVFHQRRPRRL